MKDSIIILVVDDEENIRESLADILELKGFGVLKAANGTEALALLSGKLPDLILADIMMPMMNGYQLYQRVRANPLWTWIPFIFLTAKGDAEDVRFAKELGVDDYLRKPIDVDDLIAAIYGRLKRFDDLRADAGPDDRINAASEGLSRIIGEYDLTPREIDVLEGVIAGRSNADIASDLVVGLATVKSHVSNILGKLGARSRAEVVSMVYNPGGDANE